MTDALKPDHAVSSLGLLAHISRVARHEVDAVASVGDLRPGHVVVLTTLREHGAGTQRALAAALRLDPSSLVGLLNDLEDRGLVSRRRDPEDRRRHIVALEDAGRRWLTSAEGELAPVEDRVFRALSAEERRTLHALLTRAVSGHAPPAGWEPSTDCAPSVDDAPAAADC
ncbi:MarR family winged helix-turn-helix transcriptional regulator [Patulibacter sp. NPDC049589]|uniref:MarR family winged helix-turn-helix transcriptional regulator n=1 Tax=Patulibacter sp. NPDC049589 TaxID=3154731 RepID=UPI0034143E9C